MTKVLLTNMFWFREQDIDLRKVKKAYERRMFDEKACARCEYKDERFLPEICGVCDAHLGRHVTWMTKESKNGTTLVGLPRGDVTNFHKVGIDPSELKIIDKRTGRRMVSKKLGLEWVRELWPEQKRLVKRWLAGAALERVGMEPEPFGMIQAPPRTGKCVTGETLVFTKELGLTPIKDLFPKGDRREIIPASYHIKTQDGLREVTALYQKTVDTTIGVVTRDGYRIRGTENHPMLVLTSDLSLEWKRLDALKMGDVLCVQRRGAVWPNSKDDAISVPMARLMGYLVANGYLGDAKNNYLSFTSDSKKIQRDFALCVKEALGITIKPFKHRDRTPVAHINSKDAIAKLSDLGLKMVTSARKEIPKSVLRSSEPVVRAFLEAYLTCDSWVPSHDNVELCSASGKLIRQIQVLFTNYGIVGHRKTYESSARNGHDISRKYHSLFIGSSNKEIFLRTFKLLKKTSSYRYARGRYGEKDYIPYLHTVVGATLAKSLGGGFYQVGKKKVQIKILEGKKAVKDLQYLNYNYVESYMSQKGFATVNPEAAQKLKAILKKGFYFNEITSIKRFDKPVKVYDVTVPDGANFIANGLVSHNTTMLLYCAYKLGLKIIVIANQDDLLRQFIQDLKDCTNIEEVEATEGRKFHGLVKNTEDLMKLDFGFCTWQSFREGSAKLSMIEVSKNYAIMGLDEAHRGSASKFSGVLNRSTSRYRLPVTATPERKDGLDFRVKQIMGPVVAKGQVEALEPEWSLNFTNVRPQKNISSWPHILNFLANHEERENYIISCIIQDVNAGHYVVVPVDRVEQCNKMAAKLNKRGIKAMAFHGKSDRETVLQAARAGKIKVVIGMRSILSTGVNVPRWSAYYGISPISNDPNFYQEYKRVCTKFEGKMQPILRMFVDDMGVSYGCFKTCMKQLKHLKAINQETWDRAMEIVSGKRKGDGKASNSIKSAWGLKPKTAQVKPKLDLRMSAGGNKTLAHRDEGTGARPYTGEKKKKKGRTGAAYGAKSAW